MAANYVQSASMVRVFCMVVDRDLARKTDFARVRAPETANYTHSKVVCCLVFVTALVG